MHVIGTAAAAVFDKNVLGRCNDTFRREHYKLSAPTSTQVWGRCVDVPDRRKLE